MNYYNEHDKKAAAWIRELMDAGEIPPGTVDERSITDVTPNDLRGFTQCHFFAGIAGWPLALRIAGWHDYRPIATASLPCQPFSGAGLGLGEADERHLWPVFYELVRAMRWPVIIGEQVASAAVVGGSGKKAGRAAEGEIERVWLDGVFADLEDASYTCGAADIPAAGVGAPHIRQRLFWVANRQSNGREQWRTEPNGRSTIGAGCARGLAHAASLHGPEHVGEPRSGIRRGAEARDAAERGGDSCGLEHAALPAQERLRQQPEHLSRPSGGAGTHRLAEPDDTERRTDMAGRNDRDGGEAGRDESHSESGERGAAGGMGIADGAGSQPRESATAPARHRDSTQPAGGNDSRVGNPKSDEQRRERESRASDGRIGAAGGSGPWSDFTILPCRDGKARRTQRGLFPLAPRLPAGMVPSGDPSIQEVQATAEARVMRLRGYGNAINPYVAAEFIKACVEVTDFSCLPDSEIVK